MRLLRSLLLSLALASGLSAANTAWAAEAAGTLKFSPNLAPIVCAMTATNPEHEVGFFSDFSQVILESEFPFMFCTENGESPIRKMLESELETIPTVRVSPSDIVEEQLHDFSTHDDLRFSLRVFPAPKQLPDNPPSAFHPTLLHRLFAAVVDTVYAQTSGSFRADGLSVSVQDMSGNDMAIALALSDAGDYIDLALQPAAPLRPGRYRLAIGVLRDGVIYETEQDFTWGVLAMNTYKSTYRVGESARIGIGVLDDGGHTLCNADVGLKVRSPTGAVQTFTTKAGTIKISPECADANVTDLPDYVASYLPVAPGWYTLSLTAVTENGSRSLQKTFQVVDSPDITLRRESSMRIFPVADYRMQIHAFARKRFSGEVREPVEAEFRIKDISDGGRVVRTADGSQTVVWDATMQPNSGRTFSYTYDAPNVSPEFFQLGPLSFASTSLSFTEPRAWDIASDAVASNGTLFYGDTTTTNQGDLRVRSFTAPTTWAAEFSVDLGTNTSFIQWTTARTAVTREEMAIGTLKVDGQLNIATCTTGCDASGDFSNQWNNPGTTATQDCDSAPTADTCFRGFDLGYETMSGRTLVVYGDDVADKVYYALWDGSTWGPDSSPGTPSATNEIDLPGSAGTPQWIRVVPAGENLADQRSNKIMVLVSDTNENLYALLWDGTTFSGATIIGDGSLENCSIAQCFDGNWMKTTNFVASFLVAGGSSDINYMLIDTDTGVKGDSTQAYTTTSAGQWVQSAAGPKSSRILVTTSASGNDQRSAVWRGDDVSDGWTVCSTTGCPDTTTEIVSGEQSWGVIQGVGGSGFTIYNDAGTTTTNYYMTIDFPSSWATRARTSITTSDDALQAKAWLYPNDDDVMVITTDVDCDTYGALWNGASFETATVDLELSNSMYGLACPNLTAPGTDPGGAAFNFDYAWKGYSPWSRNWRFFSDYTSNTPSTGYGGAAENSAPVDVVAGDFLRLRMQFQELTFAAETDSRKKLQWTTDNPDDPNAAWTDVGDTGDTSAVWRYADNVEACSSCSDGTSLSSSVLTGTTQNGTYITDSNDTPGANMDHSAQATVEVDYPLKAQNVTEATTYYFRAFDVQQERPVFRRQDNGAACLSSNCSYPSLVVAAGASPGGNNYFYWLE